MYREGRPLDEIGAAVQMTVPSVKHTINSYSGERIPMNAIKKVQAGHPIVAVAREFNMDGHRLRKFRNPGDSFFRKPHIKDCDIIADRLAGMSLRAIGKKYGLSAPGVYKRLKKCTSSSI